MKPIEPANAAADQGLNPSIRAFWTDNVNAERLMGRDVTTHGRGEDAYFRDLESQRYRSHRHLLPWISDMEPGRSVIEVGSGIGLDTFTMVRHGLEVVALDLTEVAVATARQRYRQEAAHPSFAVADGAHLPFPDGHFDYYYSFGVLHHAADTVACIAEAHRVLRPGGQARVMLYHRRSLNELVHRLVRVPFEERNALCPVVRRFTRAEVRDLFGCFRQVEIRLEYAFGEGYGHLFGLVPRPLYDFISRHWGWHIMIKADK